MEPDNVPETPRQITPIRWMGDSHDVLRSFPPEVQQNLGYALWQVQIGQDPCDSRSMPDIGQGVFELRDQDDRTWYRVVCLKRTAGAIWVLHSFEKKSRKTERHDVETAQRRLKRVREKVAEEGRDAKGEGRS